MRTFDQILSEMKYYEPYGKSFTKSYNCFVAEIEQDWLSEYEMAPDHEIREASRKLDFFVKSWRHAAQQLDLDNIYDKRIEDFLRVFHRAYSPEVKIASIHMSN